VTSGVQRLTSLAAEQSSETSSSKSSSCLVVVEVTSKNQPTLIYIYIYIYISGEQNSPGSSRRLRRLSVVREVDLGISPLAHTHTLFLMLPLAFGIRS
jgi:hypothetical protein